MPGTETFSQILVWESLMLENGQTHPSPQLEPGHHNSVTSFMHSHTWCAFIIKTNVASKKKYSVLFTACWEPIYCTIGLKIMLQSGTRKAKVCKPATASCGHKDTGPSGTQHHGAAGPWRGVAGTGCERLLWGLPLNPLCTGKGYFITNGTMELKNHIIKKKKKVFCETNVWYR